jgi:hypothetical protein
VIVEQAFRHVSTNSGMDGDNLVNRSEQWTQACDFAYEAIEAVRRYWDEHGRETFDNRMQGLGAQNQAAEANVAADAVTDAVIAAPDAWWHLVGGGAANGAAAIAGADAAPSPPATRSAMRAAAAAAAQLRASSG